MLAAVVLACNATAALASGVDMTAVDCPGEPGASRYADLDCAGGTSTVLFVTFAPAESIDRLMGFRAFLDIYYAPSQWAWDLVNNHQHQADSSPARPTGRCAGFAGTWDRSGSTSCIQGYGLGAGHMGLELDASNPAAIAVVKDEPLFGMQFIIDTSRAIDVGGDLGGCTTRLTMDVRWAIPVAQDSATVTTLLTAATSPSVTLNDAYAATQRHTWAQLKSLYR